MKSYIVHEVKVGDPSELETFLNGLTGEVVSVLPIVEGSSTHGIGGYVSTEAFLVIEKRSAV